MKIEELKNFLVKAKKSTYATGGGGTTSSRKKSVDLLFKEGDFEYLDSFFGQTDFSGEEIVYYQEKPLWSMNYYGRFLIEDFPAESVTVLKKALTLVEPDSPYRGPACFEQDDLRYTCEVEGSIDFYNGVEKIFHNDQEIYRLYFHGGFIK